MPYWNMTERDKQNNERTRKWFEQCFFAVHVKYPRAQVIETRDNHNNLISYGVYNVEPLTMTKNGKIRPMEATLLSDIVTLNHLSKYEQPWHDIHLDAWGSACCKLYNIGSQQEFEVHNFPTMEHKITEMEHS